MSEIAKFPRAVLQHHYPDVPLRGDFTEIQTRDHDPIDVLVGGTPCQSFSIAGLRGGMADERGNLALEYLRLADRLRPRWLVWENVPGVLSSWSGDQPPSDLAEGQEWEAVETSDFGCFISGMVKLGYGVAYRSLDAQYFHLAQRRKRLFVVGYLGDWRRAASVLFERASLRGDPPPHRETRAQPTIGTLGGTSPDGGWRFGADEAAAGQLMIVPTAFHENQRAEISVNDTVGALNSGGGKPGQGYPAVHTVFGVRRLTPRECERLQGFPDDYTLVPWRKAMATDGPRYAAIGNSMAVPVMTWIGRRIARESN